MLGASEHHHSQKWTTFEDQRHCKCWCSRLNSDTHGNIFATLGFLLHSNRRVSFIQHKITLLHTKNRTAYKGQASCMDSFIFFIKNYERVNRIEDGKWTPTLLKSDPQHSWEWTSLLSFTSLNVFQQTQHKFLKYIFPSEVYSKVLRSRLLLRPECTVVSSFIFFG